MIFNHWKALFDSFQDLWNNKGIFFAYLLPYAMVLGFLAYFADGDLNKLNGSIILLLTSFALLVVSSFSNAGLYGCSRMIYNKENTDGGEFINLAMKNLIKYFVYTLFILFVFIIGGIITYFIAGEIHFGARFIIAILFNIFFSLFFAIKFIFVMPALSENKSVFKSVIISWNTSTGHAFGTGIFFIMGYIGYAVIGFLISTVSIAVLLIPILPFVFIILGPMFLTFGSASLIFYLTKSYSEREKHVEETSYIEGTSYLDSQH